MVSDSGTTQPTSEETGPSMRPGRMLPVVADEPGAVAPAPATVPPEVRVKQVMDDWRMAIVNKDAEVVERVDRTFASESSEYLPALMISAESDPEERVRSFSTRVLGKLRSPESVALIRKLLTDRSEYVRSNAAWALGELEDRDAVGRLRELQRRDPAPGVRNSAAASLRKLDGG
jgi:hypothetical protein